MNAVKRVLLITHPTSIALVRVAGRGITAPSEPRPLEPGPTPPPNLVSSPAARPRSMSRPSVPPSTSVSSSSSSVLFIYIYIQVLFCPFFTAVATLPLVMVSLSRTWRRPCICTRSSV